MLSNRCMFVGFVEMKVVIKLINCKIRVPEFMEVIWHRQERDGTIVQTTHERDDNCACNFLHRPVFVSRSCLFRYCV
jgi:hypothetical protein